jgi:L-ribulose-5-phosphate 3-epimerase
MNKRIGIMQGRLSSPTDGKFQSFPKYTWREEFHKARNCGLKSIEWIFEADEHEKNPISSDEGIQQIKELCKITDVTIESVCADYFMDIPYLAASSKERISLKNKLIWLIQQVSKLGIKHIDLPFVDASSIESAEYFKYVIEFVRPALLVAKENDVIIALETDLKPEEFRKLLDQFDNPHLKANYDTGNSSGIGYDCTEEFNTYGEYISTIHIKDRLLNNGTKPLGTGSADFEAFFCALCNLNYNGPIILQAAREEDEEKTTIKNRLFVESYLEKYNMIVRN